MANWIVGLGIVAMASGVVWAQPVRDHRIPGAAAQWTIGRGPVDGVTAGVALYNNAKKKHLGVNASGGLVWETTQPGTGHVQFENCTRPGEIIYSSDRVTMKFRGQVLTPASGAAGVSLGGPECSFRIIPNRVGLVPAGGDDGTFAIYSISANGYLTVGGGGKLGLRWSPTDGGRPPRNVAARADFVPVDVITTTPGQVVYLAIQNVGNVRSSASQQDLHLRLNDQPTTLLIVQPVEPGAMLRGIVKVTKPVGACADVQLDTNPTYPNLKFQVGEGAFPNDDVFANDRRKLKVRVLGSVDERAAPPAPLDCDPVVR